MARLVLIDDDAHFRLMLAETLRAAGHEVREAENGAKGLAEIAADPPDLVITDIIMPEVEGIETIFSLRRSHPRLKVIAISGGGRITADDHLLMAKKMGASAVLSKPFPAATMEATIRRVLNQG